jgi:hypothetical protein
MGWQVRDSDNMRECMSFPTCEPDEEMKEDSQKRLSVETSETYGRRVVKA